MANGDLAVVEALRLLSHKTLVSFADLPKIPMLALLKSQKREDFCDTNSLAYRKIQTICGVVMFLNVQFFLNETMTPYGATFLMITVEICPAASLSPAILMRSWAISNVNFTGSPHCSLPPGSTFALTRVQSPLNRPCG